VVQAEIRLNENVAKLVFICSSLVEAVEQADCGVSVQRNVRGRYFLDTVLIIWQRNLTSQTPSKHDA